MPALHKVTAQVTAVDQLTAALEAAARGWRVFPLTPGRKTPRRAASQWEHKATTDPDRVARWWDRHPTDNVGIATGPSGLVVVDLDTPKPGDHSAPEPWRPVTHGVEVFDTIAAGHELPATWTVATPTGGWHLYYQAPAGPELRNTAGRLGWKIDTRANGGFVVAAGSVVDGRPYRLHDDTPPAELPVWLLQLLTPPRPTASTRPARLLPRTRGYVGTALAAEVQRVLDAGPGTRNHTLNAAAWSLARFVAQGVVARHVIEHALQAAGEATGLTPAETTATIRSALDTRTRRPGGPAPMNRTGDVASRPEAGGHVCPGQTPAPKGPTAPEIGSTGHTAPASKASTAATQPADALASTARTRRPAGAS